MWFAYECLGEINFHHMEDTEEHGGDIFLSSVFLHVLCVETPRACN